MEDLKNLIKGEGENVSNKWGGWKVWVTMGSIFSILMNIIEIMYENDQSFQRNNHSSTFLAQ